MLLQNAINVLNTKLARETDSNSKKDSKQLMEIMITTEEWNLLQNLVEVLEPFAEATDYLGGSTYCTYSIINPVIEEIKKELIKPTESSSQSSSQSLQVSSPPLLSDINQQIVEDAFAEDSENQNQRELQPNLNHPVINSSADDLLKTVKKELYENLCKYWNFQDSNALLATLLDPRTKNLEGVPVQIQLETEELLRDKVEELKLNEVVHDLPNSISITSREPRYNNSIFTKFKKSKPKAVDDEILEYLKLNEIGWEENPFTWWAHEEKHFHYLSILARKYLPIPAASTASERMFSDAGNIMGPKRTRMNPELFKRILFLKHNSKMVPSVHPPIS